MLKKNGGGDVTEEEIFFSKEVDLLKVLDNWLLREKRKVWWVFSVMIISCAAVSLHV